MKFSKENHAMNVTGELGELTLSEVINEHKLQLIITNSTESNIRQNLQKGCEMKTSCLWNNCSSKVL
jgi:hypothetical protein